jgi:hypothetical protein
MSWQDELQRRMWIEESMRKAVGLDDITTKLRQEAELAAMTPYARNMTHLYAPQYQVPDVLADRARETVLRSQLLLPASPYDIRQLYQDQPLGAADLQARQGIESYWERHQRHFTIPESTRLQQLATDVHFQRDLHISTSSIVAEMQRMHTPWLDTRHALESATGFATIHAIGYGATHAPFASDFTETLRQQLGDWRDVTAVPQTIFEDPAARAEFYFDRGFQGRLVEFPPEAFEEVIENAGLFPAEEEDELQLVWNDRTYRHVLRIEYRLRIFVNEVMTREFGENWPDRLPELVKRWKETKQKRLKEGQPERPHLIHYSELSDLAEIMQRKDHFPFFKPAFHRIESMQELFRRVLPARHAVMHCGVVTQIDYLTVMTEHARLRRVIEPEN